MGFRTDVKRPQQFRERRKRAGKNIMLNLRRQFQLAHDPLTLGGLAGVARNIFLEIIRHLVERLRKKPDLVLPLFGNFRIQIALSQPDHLANQLFDRRIDKPRHHIVGSVKHHQRKENEQRDEDPVAEFDQRKNFGRRDLHGKQHPVIKFAGECVKLRSVDPEMRFRDFQSGSIRNAGVPRDHIQRTPHHAVTAPARKRVGKNTVGCRIAQKHKRMRRRADLSKFADHALNFPIQRGEPDKHIVFAVNRSGNRNHQRF